MPSSKVKKQQTISSILSGRKETVEIEKTNKPTPPMVCVIPSPSHIDQEKENGLTASAAYQQGMRNKRASLRTPPKNINILEGTHQSPRHIEHNGKQCGRSTKVKYHGIYYHILTEHTQDNQYLQQPQKQVYCDKKSKLYKNRENLLTKNATKTNETTITLKNIQTERQSSNQEIVMGKAVGLPHGRKHLAAAYLGFQGVKFFNEQKKKVHTVSQLKKSQIIIEWGHIIADTIGGENSADNLMAVTKACNKTESALTAALKSALIDYEKTLGKDSAGQWKLTVISELMPVYLSATANRSEEHIGYLPNAAINQRYIYQYTSADGQYISLPIEFTLDPLDPNKFSHTGVKALIKAKFACIMRGEPLHDLKQTTLRIENPMDEDNPIEMSTPVIATHEVEQTTLPPSGLLMRLNLHAPKRLSFGQSSAHHADDSGIDTEMPNNDYSFLVSAQPPV